MFGSDIFDIAQLFGLLSFVIGTYAFSQKNDQKLKFSLGCLFLCQTLHFYLLGSTTGAIANSISFIRTAISIKFHGKYLGWIFIALNIAWGIPMVEKLVDVLPIVAACCGTFAIFFLHGIKMRLAFMTGAVCWIINNIVVGSIGGVMLESMVLITNFITIIRLKRAAKLPFTP